MRHSIMEDDMQCECIRATYKDGIARCRDDATQRLTIPSHKPRFAACDYCANVMLVWAGKAKRKLAVIEPIELR
jgi:hypothetical protein